MKLNSGLALPLYYIFFFSKIYVSDFLFLKVIKRFAIFFSVLCAIIIGIIYSILNKKQPLPIRQPEMFNPELVDESIQHVSKYHTIADFSLINQNGDTITQDTYKD